MISAPAARFALAILIAAVLVAAVPFLVGCSTIPESSIVLTHSDLEQLVAETRACSNDLAAAKAEAKACAATAEESDAESRSCALEVLRLRRMRTPIECREARWGAFW